MVRKLVFAIAIFLGAYATTSLAASLDSKVDPAAVRQELERFTSFGASRVVGYDGHEAAAEYIQAQFYSIGLEDIQVDEFDVPVPMDEGAYLTCEGQKPIRVYPLWPNLIRPPTLPADGVTGRLVYVGKGTPPELNGKDIAGNIVVMDFNSDDNYLDLRVLGAKAIIFTEPKGTIRGQAEKKLLGSPVNVPRYWLRKADGQKLVDSLRNGASPKAKLTAKMVWKRAKAKNIYAFLPGSEFRDEIIVISSYYDSMSIVPSLAPGAEQATGIVALLDLARKIKAAKPRRSVLFVAFDAHCIALGGARDFLFRHCRTEKFRAKVYDPEIAARMNDPITFKLWVGLDLSSRSNRLGVFYTGHFTSYRHPVVITERRFFAGYGKVLTRYAREIDADEHLARAVESLKAKNMALTPKEYELARKILCEFSTFSMADLNDWVDRALSAEEGQSAKTLAEQLQAVVDKLVAAGVVRRFTAFTVKKEAKPKTSDKTEKEEAEGAEGTETPKEPDPKEFILKKGGAFELQDIVREALAEGIPEEKTRKAFEELKAQGAFEQKTMFEFATKRLLENGITPIGGVVWQDYIPCLIAFDTEMGVKIGLPMLTFATVNDARLQVDTPFDTVKTMGSEGVKNVCRQIEILSKLFSRILNAEDLIQESQVKLRDQAKILKGQIVEFRIGKSLLPDYPVPDALVVLRESALKGKWESTFTGVRAPRIAMTGEDGYFEDDFVYDYGVTMEPYKINYETGKIVYAADRGPEGDQTYPLSISVDWALKETRAVVFRCESLDIFGLIDPRYLRTLDTINVLGPLDFPPLRYGYSELNGPAASVFFQPEGRVKVIVGAGIFGIQYLLINADEQHPTGVGFAANPEGAIFRSDYCVARDMYILNSSRIKDLAAYGIRNERLNRLHGRGGRALAAAKQALERRDYDTYFRETRAARGFEAKAYPDVRSTANDTVKGIIFYFALLIPFAVFTERLLFCFADIRKQISMAFLIFVLVFAILRFVHPAFKISTSPYVIFLAFILLAMATIVITMVVRRFNEQIAEMRRKAARVHEADVGRLSASAAAFNLGISNMKKRKMRTALTTTTLILLTFTVLSFTSVHTYTRFNKIPVKAKPSYEGVLIRDRNWNELEDFAIDYIHSAFEDIAFCLPRAWYMCSSPTDPLYLTIQHGDKATTVMAAVGMTADEPRATPIGQILIAGRWLKPHEDDTCVLPSEVADRLGITPGSVKNEPRVFLFGRYFRVVGLLDSTKVNDILDLDGEPLSPIDVTADNPNFGKQETEATLRQNATELKTFTHLNVNSVVIVPYDFLMLSGGTLRSIALVTKPSVDFVDFVAKVKRFLSRVGMTIFVAEGNRVTAYSSIGLSSFSGMSNLFVPIAIAALIVLNTMMGSVYERFREIGIYSSVGLAPVHIAALFMAESCVYAVMGAITGYLIGQVVGTTMAYYGVLSGITLNYSSISTVASTAIVMATVLLSTLYPAHVASRMAVPDVTRRWKFPEPDGDTWVFDFPFTVATKQVLGLYVFLNNYFDGYKEESVGSFYTDDVRFSAVEGEYGLDYIISMKVWLAPFDMGISQSVELRALQTEDVGISRIQVVIHRLSGEVSAWKRMNKGFLTEIRKQFLIWRTIPESVKMEYADEGKKLLSEMGFTVEV